jgi:hypothetical protein
MHRLEFSATPLALPKFRVRDLGERFAGANPMTIADEINDKLTLSLAEPGDDKRLRERRVRSNLQQLDSILHHDRHFWVDELDGVARKYPYRRILEIFVRVNSGGTKLTAGDLMFAAMKEGWDDIEQRVEDTVDLLNGGKLNIDQDFVLKCLLLAHGQGAEVQTEKFYGPRGEALLKTIEANWDAAEQAFQQLRDFIVRSVRVVSDRLIPSYNALVPLFDFLFHNRTPGEASRARMAAYFHKAQLFGWYGRQTDAVLNALHNIVGKDSRGEFPLTEIKSYFGGRGMLTELDSSHLQDSRLRPIILNIVYCDRWGSSPFDVASKRNAPHIDHIYPQYMLRSRLGCGSPEINDIGNLRFFGATDNIRKRAELPASYFLRLRRQGVAIEKHLLVPEYAADPTRLEPTREAYDRFRVARRDEIWHSAKRCVDLEG